MSDMEFEELRKKRDKEKVNGFIIGAVISGFFFILLSLWMFQQNDIDSLVSFIMLWWGVVVLIIALTMQITKNME